MITHTKLRELFMYDQNTGLFIRNITMSSRAQKGNIAGTLCPDGYISISINRKIYRAHRLVWLYCFEEWPSEFIDHINGIRNDNRLDNLREVTKTINAWNTKAHIDNMVGIKGVYFNKQNNNYRAQIRFNGKTVSLGSFKTPEEAKEAYDNKAKEIQGEFFPNR